MLYNTLFDRKKSTLRLFFAPHYFDVKIYFLFCSNRFGEMIAPVIIVLAILPVRFPLPGLGFSLLAVFPACGVISIAAMLSLFRFLIFRIFGF